MTEDMKANPAGKANMEAIDICANQHFQRYEFSFYDYSGKSLRKA